MTPAERRTACIRLLAEIDQDIRETESLLADDLLSRDERRYVSVCRDFYRKAAERAERLLEKV